jgi:hypothetical protein
VESTGSTQTLFAKIDKSASTGNEKNIFVQVTPSTYKIGFTEDFEGASTVYDVDGGSIDFDEWVLGSFVISKTGVHGSDVKIFKNGVLAVQEQVNDQFSDIKGATTLIGCS